MYLLIVITNPPKAQKFVQPLPRGRSRDRHSPTRQGLDELLPAELPDACHTSAVLPTKAGRTPIWECCRPLGAEAIAGTFAPDVFPVSPIRAHKCTDYNTAPITHKCTD